MFDPDNKKSKITRLWWKAEPFLLRERKSEELHKAIDVQK